MAANDANPVHVAMKLLRLLDGNKLAIGKIYDRMFTIGQRIDKLKGTISWATAMAEIHTQRWEVGVPAL